ncbi:hypothetical protein [Maridesulfovibrio zosterae]|uniref:hypothetical protein n=1 Tax=Maridesulfovibrio zosterae TaxID=82171 RepID=UPI000417DC8F|nr:hypothetical protein [Maridesulfovibrio zosterae]
MAKSIFDLGLSVEAVSLFLLIEGMAGSKIDAEKNCKASTEGITVHSCIEKWSGEEVDFNSALEELVAAGVVKNRDSDLSITKTDTWKTK